MSGSGATGGGTTTLSTSDDPVADAGDTVIQQIPISAPGLTTQGSWLTPFTCNKICLDNDPTVRTVWVTVTTQLASGSATTVSETPTVCAADGSEGTVPADDKQSRGMGEPINSFTGGLYK